MLPGSIIFSVTTPSNGAAMRENVSAVSAASLAAAHLPQRRRRPVPRRGAGGARFSRAQCGRDIVKLLQGGRAFGVEAGDTCA